MSDYTLFELLLLAVCTCMRVCVCVYVCVCNRGGEKNTPSVRLAPLTKETALHFLDVIVATPWHGDRDINYYLLASVCFIHRACNTLNGY